MMNETPKRRLKKRHVAGGTLLGGAALVLMTWADIAPEVCPVLPERVARHVCAARLLDPQPPDGGTP